MSSRIVSMERMSPELTVDELSEALREGIRAELRRKCIKRLDGTDVLLMVFEKLYLRNGSYAGLTLMVTGDGQYQEAEVIGTGGGTGLLNISWGTNEDFADMAVGVLKSQGFKEKNK